MGNKKEDNKIDLRNEQIQEMETKIKSEHRAEFEERIERMKIKNEKKVDIFYKKIKEVERPVKKIREKKSFDSSFSDIPSNIRKISFPKNFLWGVSTSAYQIEGGIQNDWSVWESHSAKASRNKNKKNKNFKSVDFTCDKAVDSYNRWEEDLNLVKELNLGAYRMGIEWARVQSSKGTWDVAELNHYRRVLEGAQKRGLKTVVTLWHWTNPVWLTKEKGWENKKVVEYFQEYTKMIVAELGGLVDFWVTLNEPMVHVVNGYINGKFPPGKKLSPRKAFKVFRNLYKAHKVSYKTIHDYFPEAKVSITNLTNCFEPARSWLIPEVFLTKIFSYFSNDWFLNKIKNHIDFIGMDYYFHNRIIMYPPFKKNKNVFITDMHWEIYPKGIYKALKDLSKYKVPIYVMENGLADKDDKYRVQFIKEHLYWTWRAIEEGVDVRGYFHWSLLDNFEWDKGFAPKFGLYEVNRETFERKARGSARVYGEICKNNSVQF